MASQPGLSAGVPVRPLQHAAGLQARGCWSLRLALAQRLEALDLVYAAQVDGLSLLAFDSAD